MTTDGARAPMQLPSIAAGLYALWHPRAPLGTVRVVVVGFAPGPAARWDDQAHTYADAIIVLLEPFADLTAGALVSVPLSQLVVDVAVEP